MRVRIVAFGKLKTPGLREALDYYIRNLKPWADVEEVELKPLSVPDKSPATRKKIQEKESELLLEKLCSSPKSHGKHQGEARRALILLDESGLALPTREWSARLRSWEESGTREACFCIGSSLGFAPSLRARAHAVLSLGAQTLPHELARVVLGEQLYRAFSVLQGHPYHNEG